MFGLDDSSAQAAAAFDSTELLAVICHVGTDIPTTRAMEAVRKLPRDNISYDDVRSLALELGIFCVESPSPREENVRRSLRKGAAPSSSASAASAAAAPAMTIDPRLCETVRIFDLGGPVPLDETSLLAVISHVDPDLPVTRAMAAVRKILDQHGQRASGDSTISLEQFAAVAKELGLFALSSPPKGASPPVSQCLFPRGPTVAGTMAEVRTLQEFSFQLEGYFSRFDPSQLEYAVRSLVPAYRNRQRELWQFLEARYELGADAQQQQQQRLDSLRTWSPPPMEKLDGSERLQHSLVEDLALHEIMQQMLQLKQ